MLTHEMNELLTRVGPGTPCGELMRRYWHPIAAARELTEEKPKKRVRILGEDLVLFRDGQGNYGLLNEQCSHRGASLYYGFVEDGGIRCAYHGWKYDVNGKCLEQPFESNPDFKNKVCQKAYPVEKLAGLIFAYLGPPTIKPLLPRWDMLVAEGFRRTVNITTPVINCSWLQSAENSADPLHTYFLHGHAMRTQGINRGAYLYRPIDKSEVEQTEWGLRKKRTYTGEDPEAGHLLIFPNLLRHPRFIRWNVPIDDTHTQRLSVHFFRLKEDERVDLSEDPPINYHHVKNEEGEFHMESIASQDCMTWETSGPIYNRTNEHLGESDEGIILYRKILADQISIVQKGGEPMGLVRDPEKNKIIELTITERLPTAAEQIVYRRDNIG